MRLWTARATAAALVLALGVALGAGPLQGDADRDSDELARQVAAVADRDRTIDDLRAAQDGALAFVDATAPRLVNGVLTGRTVAVITFSGSDPVTVSALGDLIEAAGGKVTARVSLAASLGASSSRGLLDALTSQMIAASPAVPVPDDASGDQRFGALLARAVATPEKPTRKDRDYDETAVGIISGFTTAKLLDEARVSARADLVLVVAPATGDAEPVEPLLAAFADRARVVLAGSTGKPLAGGTGLSTVVGTESSTGRVAAVLALAARSRGTTGDWGGPDAADGVLPPLS